MRNLRFNILPAATLGVLCLLMHAPLNGEAKAPDTIVLKGPPLGSVTFQHKLHVTRAGDKCVVCHHASKPEKPGSSEQPCAKCHSKPLPPGMKTSLQGAFHKPTAQSGTCIDCHKKENAAGKKAPIKCVECHKKGKA
ncbi:MAG: cytochrome c3 family protein [Bryobacterales bacterium]|nr:cytochrome c3 family protein [Bryobacterales bacterium]